MNVRYLKTFLAITVIAILSGCASKNTHYHWGEYENIVRDMYIEPGSEDPATQIEKLKTDIQQAENRGKPVPPGIYAHLGFMYALEGKVELSVAAFDQEKSLFPESKIFIDGMMARAKQNAGVAAND